MRRLACKSLHVKTEKSCAIRQYTIMTGMVFNMEIALDVTKLHLRWINDFGIGDLCLPILSPLGCLSIFVSASTTTRWFRVKHFVRFTSREMYENNNAHEQQQSESD